MISGESKRNLWRPIRIIVIDPKMSYGFIGKSPLTPLCQRGGSEKWPLRKRGGKRYVPPLEKGDGGGFFGLNIFGSMMDKR